jgi:hypothetical protein
LYRAAVVWASNQDINLMVEIPSVDTVVPAPRCPVLVRVATPADLPFLDETKGTGTKLRGRESFIGRVGRRDLQTRERVSGLLAVLRLLTASLD